MRGLKKTSNQKWLLSPYSHKSLHGQMTATKGNAYEPKQNLKTLLLQCCREPRDTSYRGQAHTDETLKEMEQKIDARAARIGLVVADIFTFLTRPATMLPDMELHTDTIDLTINDSDIVVHICHPTHDDADDYEEEEELLYDGN